MHKAFALAVLASTVAVPALAVNMELYEPSADVETEFHSFVRQYVKVPYCHYYKLAGCTRAVAQANNLCQALR